MFAQLCTDLPWTQHLSAVWRMHDPDERSASLALRNGGPASARRAVGWYRTHDRLHCGDEITMAADALAAYKTDIAAGKDALLVCDTAEMTDALNRRLHHDTISSAAPTVTGVRGHRIAVGDLILTRRNDVSIPLRHIGESAAEQSSVRNGQRWHVTHINPATNGLAARRLDDNALGAFPGGYVQDHISHGYSVTVHSAQGVTADTTHAVLGDNAPRALAYVALTRGRDNNAAYLYQRAAEGDDQHASPLREQTAVRGSIHQAAILLRAILARDDRPTTANEAAQVADWPGRTHVHDAIERRARAMRRRSSAYRYWSAGVITSNYLARENRLRDASAERSVADGLEL
jgi:hypothetical protein